MAGMEEEEGASFKIQARPLYAKQGKYLMLVTQRKRISRRAGALGREEEVNTIRRKRKRKEGYGRLGRGQRPLSSSEKEGEKKKKLFSSFSDPSSSR